MARSLVTVAAAVISALGTVSAFSNGDAIRILASHIGPVNNRMYKVYDTLQRALHRRARLLQNAPWALDLTALRSSRLQHPKLISTAFCPTVALLMGAIGRQILLNL